MEEEPDPARMPPDLDDFPHDVQMAIVIFGKLSDRIVADVGYLGKDYTALPVHMEVSNIENKEIFLETLIRLDQTVIEKSAKAMKREREKLKNRK